MGEMAWRDASQHGTFKCGKVPSRWILDEYNLGGCIHKAQSKESWSITPATNAMHWKPEESNSIIATIGQTVESFRSNLDGHTRKRINGNKLIKSVLATVSLTKQPYRGHLSHSLLLSSLSWC